MRLRVTFGALAWGVVLGGLALIGSGRESPVQGQNPELAGVYQLVPERSDDIGQAIHEATEEAGFFVRTFGRGMLADRLQPPSVVQIVLTDTTVILTEDGSETRAHLLSDAERDRTGEPEEGVRAMWVGGSLVRTFKEKDGVRRYGYSVGPAGDTLAIDVDIEGSRLPRPVRYRLTYVVR